PPSMWLEERKDGSGHRRVADERADFGEQGQRRNPVAIAWQVVEASGSEIAEHSFRGGRVSQLRAEERQAAAPDRQRAIHFGGRHDYLRQLTQASLLAPERVELNAVELRRVVLLALLLHPGRARAERFGLVEPPGEECQRGPHQRGLPVV